MDTDRQATEPDYAIPRKHAERHDITGPHDMEVVFDGRTFIITEEFGYLNGMILLYLIRRARNGDAAARDVLTAFGVEIEDADGVAYWPMGE